MPESLLTLPTELLQYIASYAHTTHDIISLAAVNHTLHAALASGTVFELRIRAGGWDTEAWESEALSLTRKEKEAEYEPVFPVLPPPFPVSAPVLAHWHRASALHDRAVNSLQEASSCEFYFFHSTDVAPFNKPGFHLWYPRWCFTPWGVIMFDCGADPYPPTDPLRGDDLLFIDGEKAFAWFMSFGEVLEDLIAHNDTRNIRQLSASKLDITWRIILRTLLGVYSDRQLPLAPSSLPSVHKQATAFADAASAFAVFVLSLDGIALTAIFNSIAPFIWDASFIRASLSSHVAYTHARLFTTESPLAPSSSEDLVTATTLARRRAACAAIVITTYLLLHLRQGPADTLPPPTFPLTRAIRSSSPLAGTPLGALLDMGTNAKQDWGGYYFYARRPEGHARDPPMFLDLSARRSTNEPEIIFFTGNGADEHGAFVLSGRVHSRTAAFRAHKVYHELNAGSTFEWTGVVSAFGIVGCWGSAAFGGPVWIWPREWSKE